MIVRNILSKTGTADPVQLQQRHDSCSQNNEYSYIEQKIASLIHAATDGVCIIDQYGSLIEFNESFIRMLGYTREDIKGMHILQWEPSWNCINIRDQMAASPAHILTVETVHHRKNKSYFDVEVTYSQVPINGEHYVCATSKDISERNKLEQDLRIAATAFEAHEAMLITDAEQRVLRVNQEFSVVSGYRAEDVLGESFSILHANCQVEPAYADMWKKVRQQGYWRGEMYTQRKNGEFYLVWCTMTAVSKADGSVTNYVFTMTDITHRKTAEREIRELAHYDPLTKLGNRYLLHERLQKNLDSIGKTNSNGALFFIDLDNFKTINETAGHETGDKLLQHVSQRLLDCVRSTDTVVRLGGDEFVIILADLGPQIDQATKFAQQIGERILTHLNAPYDFDNNVYYSSPSIGVAMFGSGGETVTELLRRADLAMYEAKAAGKNVLRNFVPAMQDTVTARSKLESAMRRGLQHNGFILHYQPQISCNGNLLGAEALVRWYDPERGWLSPSEFIPVAEESGLIIPLGLQVLAMACHQLVEWEQQFTLDDFSISVNVSARQFRHPEFVQQVMDTIKQTGVNPHKLKLELTETMLVDNYDDTIAKMTTLKCYGIGFSLDDFGTGYSSLSYLKRLPLDQLKIDQSFVRDVLLDQDGAAITQMIVTLGSSLRLVVIAEGVETEEQRAFLARQGCHAYQGYLFGRPMTADSFRAYLSVPAQTLIPAPSETAIISKSKPIKGANMPYLGSIAGD